MKTRDTRRLDVSALMLGKFATEARSFQVLPAPSYALFVV